MVGILLNSCSPKGPFQRLRAEPEACLEGMTARVRIGGRVAKSELLKEDAVLRLVQGALNYKFREGTADGEQFVWPRATTHQAWYIFGAVSGAQVAS